MRSKFFQEIAESRERFYARQFGDNSVEPDSSDFSRGSCTNQSSENHGWADSLGQRRQSLLLDFLGKMKFWIGF